MTQARFRAVINVILTLLLCCQPAHGSNGHQSASDYCHEGFLAIHRATGYKEASVSHEWDLKTMAKAQDNFLECGRRARADGNPELESRAMTADAYTLSLIAQMAETYAVRVRYAKPPDKTPAQSFKRFRDDAISMARSAIELLDRIYLSGYASEAWTD